MLGFLLYDALSTFMPSVNMQLGRVRKGWRSDRIDSKSAIRKAAFPWELALARGNGLTAT